MSQTLTDGQDSAGQKVEKKGGDILVEPHTSGPDMFPSRGARPSKHPWAIAGNRKIKRGHLLTLRQPRGPGISLDPTT